MVYVLTLLAAAVAAANMHLMVRARPNVMLGGSDLRIECRVPRIPTYRSVEWGVDCESGFRRASYVQLPGRVIHETLTRVPDNTCGVCEVFCVVEQHDGLGAVHAPPARVVVKGIGCPDEP